MLYYTDRLFILKIFKTMKQIFFTFDCFYDLNVCNDVIYSSDTESSGTTCGFFHMSYDMNDLYNHTQQIFTSYATHVVDSPFFVAKADVLHYFRMNFFWKTSHLKNKKFSHHNNLFTDNL